MEKKIGNWAFIIGVVLAIILGLAAQVLPDNTEGILASVLVVLGLIVGFINIAGKETKDFMITSAILVIISSIGTIGGGVGSTIGSIAVIGPYLASVLMQILAFVVPATLVVALKEIYYIAQ